MDKKIFFVFLFVFFANYCLSKSLIPELEDISYEDVYFCISSKSGTFLLFKGGRDEPLLRVQLSNGKIKTYRPKYLGDFYFYEHDDKGEKKRENIFKKEPLFLDIINVKSYQNGIVIINFFRGDSMVQFINEKFEVTSSWKEDLPSPGSSWRYPKGVKTEPFTVVGEDTIVMTGESGELLFFNKDGKVFLRLVVKRLFNIERKVKPREPTEDEKKYVNLEFFKSVAEFDARTAAKYLAERDKILPAPIFIKGDEFPQSIKAMESRDNGNIIILDGEMTDEELEKVKKGEMEYRYQKLYELNPETAEIKLLQIPGFKLLREDIQLKEEKGDKISQDEIIIDIRCKNDILCILTRYRALTVEFEPELRVTGEYHFRFDDEKYNNKPWDVTYTKPVKFLVVNLEERRIDEYQPLPEKVGTPLDTGVAEEKRREEAEEAEEIRVLEEFEKRHTAEKKITPVLEADKEAARRLVDLFHKRVIAGEFDKIPDMLHNDFVSEMITTKKTYVEEVVPQMYSDIKKIGVIAEIKSKIGESFYTDDTRSIIKSQVELILIDKDGKVRESEKGKVIFYFYFIKTKNGMQILEMDIKDRTERFKKDETEDTTEVE